MIIHKQHIFQVNDRGGAMTDLSSGVDPVDHPNGANDVPMAGNSHGLSHMLSHHFSHDKPQLYVVNPCKPNAIINIPQQKQLKMDVD